MPPTTKETAVASRDKATRIGTSLATKRSREDDLGMDASSSSQVGSKKRKKGCGYMIVTDPPSKIEQKMSSRDAMINEVETPEGNAEDRSEDPDSIGESDDSDSSGPEHNDIIELDRQDITEQLSSGSSILVLETTSNWRSYCRANFCIPKILRGRPNIECDYRFNLMDRTGDRRSDTAWYPQPSRFFHISCIEHLFDLREILDQGWMKMEGGISFVGIFGNTVREERFPTIIEEWFENKGSVFTIDEYKAYKKACETRERERSGRWITHSKKTREDEKHEEQCCCAWEIPEINKSDYFPAERTPRLLSQVLASLAKVSQIDGLTESLLAYLKDMSAKEGTECLKELAEDIQDKREQKAKSDSDGSKVSDFDQTGSAAASAGPPE